MSPQPATLLVVHGTHLAVLAIVGADLMERSALDAGSPFFGLLGDRRLACAVASVLERPSDSHTVESLAAIAGMSRSTFAAHFAELFQQTPIDFVQHVRLRLGADLGADLLQTTDLPINVIASVVGYASRSYFTRHSAQPTRPTPKPSERARRSANRL